MTNWIDADIADTPYNFRRRLSATDIEVQYGNTRIRERWRFWKVRTVTMSTYRIKVGGRYYRFAGRLDRLQRRG